MSLAFPITASRRAYSSAELSYKFTKVGILDEIIKYSEYFSIIENLNYFYIQ